MSNSGITRPNLVNYRGPREVVNARISAEAGLLLDAIAAVYGMSRSAWLAAFLEEAAPRVARTVLPPLEEVEAELRRRARGTSPAPTAAQEGCSLTDEDASHLSTVATGEGAMK